MAFAFSVSLVDPVGFPKETEDRLVSDLEAALRAWSNYIAGVGPVVVLLRLGSSPLGTASGGAASVAPAFAAGALDVVRFAGQSALLDGNPNAAPSINIAVDRSFVSTMLSDSSIGDFAVTIFEHELAHGFAMSGYRNSTGALYGRTESVYDTYVALNGDGTASFTGPNAEAVYGGPVPLTTNYAPENYYHLGNGNGDPVVGSDLMNGTAVQRGTVISDLDVAILQDVGVPVTRLVSRAASPVDTFAAPDGSRRTLTYADAADARRAQPLLDRGGGSTLQLVSGEGLAAASRATVVVDGGPTTLFGSGASGQAVIAGDQRLAFSALGSGSLVAGGGGDQVFIVGANGPWMVATGGGDDTVLAASGADSIDAGGGANLLFLGSGASSVVSEGVDTVVGAAGLTAVTVLGPGALAFAGEGGLLAALNNGVSTVAGLSNRITVTGGTGAGLFFGGSAGANQITAPTASSTIIGGGDGDVLRATGAGGDVIAAGPGAETITGAGSTGANVFFAGSGADVIVGGAGATAIAAGSGNATLTAGSGPVLFVFNNGAGGGNDVVIGFDARLDRLLLAGFGPGVPDSVLAAARVDGATTTLTLPDGTHIAFVGSAAPPRSDFV